jgi:hypothetical protein
MFKKTLDELDEANEYTRFRYTKYPLPRNNVVFTIEVMIDVLSYHVDDPEIAIRCRRKRDQEVLFLWSYEKF